MPKLFRAAVPAYLLLGIVAFLSLPGEARAHFLFARIGPAAEGGRSAEVFFSEFAKAGDPRFIPKIAHTKLWVQTKPGAFEPLVVQAGADRLRAMLPAAPTLSVVGECEYGVLNRPNQPPFLLRHYPKAIAGAIDGINQLERRPQSRLEIVAKLEASGSTPLRLIAFREGKSIPDIEFHAVAEDLTETKIKADDKGSIAWTPPSPGAYCFYIGDTVKQSGELDGKRYEEIREFATLSIDWPLGPRKPSAEASEVFHEAVAKRAQWRNFPGFSAEVSGDLDGRAFSGKITITAKGKAEIEVDDDAALPWIRSQLDSLVTHRIATDSGETSKTGPHAVTLQFADEADDHPLGRLLLVEGGRMASSYRIKDGEIKTVNRDLGDQALTLTILDNEVNRDGLTLPRGYVSQYWHVKSGRLTKTETFQDRWKRFDAWDLPLSHTVTTATDGGLSVRTIEFSKHAITKQP